MEEVEDTSAELCKCFIETTLNEECHAKCYVRTIGSRLIKDLSKEEQRLLKLRTKVENISAAENTICNHHRAFYLTQ